ncbi:DUF397 domain-containing protein [Actinoplanes sp. NPDC049265]|uniref:DUF397 domain-containing protein n=1 Tax=Actinoplanes sp. NPDC049265 TaxID=3363902 RepID=UPI003717020B
MIESRQHPVWRRSRRCTGGNCVEVAKLDGHVLVRNSAEPEVVVTFSHAEWAAFLAGVDEFR